MGSTPVGKTQHFFSDFLRLSIDFLSLIIIFLPLISNLQSFTALCLTNLWPLKTGLNLNAKKNQGTWIKTLGQGENQQ